MAKEKERKALKKGKASFNLIGRVKVTDKTFNLDNSYDSGWTDNSMYVGVDCGGGNVIYAEEILHESINKIREIIEEKNPDLPDKEIS